MAAFGWRSVPLTTKEQDKLSNGWGHGTFVPSAMVTELFLIYLCFLF